MIMDWLAYLCAIAVSIPMVVIGVECLVTLVFLPNRAPISTPDSLLAGAIYKVLVPAHNEADIIADTLGTLIAQLPDADPAGIILIADNCTDGTASIARSLGVTVLERHDTDRRGKGFALDFGIRYLRANNPPDVVVVMDADCETSKSAFVNLVNTAMKRKLPAQMNYLMRPRGNASIKQKIAGFAWLLKNKIRLFAVDKLTVPVTLTGTGMAFPWEVFDHVDVGHGNIVEDMQLGIDCAIKNFPPVFCANALVWSDFPEQAAAEQSQRTRWEHGHLQTIFHQVPALIKQAWQQKNWRLLALALDIGVPPLSLLVTIALGGLALLALFSIITGETAAFFILLASFSFFAAMLVTIWWFHGQDYLAGKELLGIPVYVISKFSIYSNFVRKRQKEWVRTNRDT